ncbi:Putative disease resistance RPP13-like protein [Arachis hypogaea]|nr:Putative disease resistance RPP13-like protein [Arachis hypogaea]
MKKLDRKLVERLKTALLAAEALVADAEQKQFGNDRVRKWFDSLRDALYTADDLLDCVFIKTEIRNKVRTHLPSFLNLSDRKMVTKIEEVVKTIEDLEKLKDTLGLEKIPTSSSSWRPPSTSLVKGNVYGRDGDQQALIKMLNDNNDHNLSVSSIVGMGGVGKTTLAQWLFNNKDLMDGVDLKAWICVSENFDVVETTKNVIKGISSGVCSLDSFDLLQQHLKEKLSEKKFFIVLDDVWSEDVDKWNSFVTPFQHGRKGSTILLTTCKENVGRIVQHYNSYTLKELSDDYCWSIFADNASFPESNGSSELEEIGRKIVKRCDGLPLAAETLGCLLRSERRVEEWNKILSNDIWEFPMPNRVAQECFDDLVSRLFFKQGEDYFRKYFVMHDLMHDLGTSLAGNLYCKFSEELSEKEEMSILTRHLSYGDSIPEKICSSNKIESLRTLLYLEHGAYARKGLATLPDKLIQLRYLDLSWSDIVVLPESLCKLCNLQTLKLEYCFKLTMLANGMYKLVNLRHLDIRGTPLKEMPKGMGKLKQLHILSKFVARSARIIDKKHIDELLLKWSLSSGDDMVSNTHTDEQDILHGLQPHTGLKKFIVDIYKGKIFPDWIGHSLYQNMTSVSLQYCWNCCVLPSLGQLPSLKSLSIKRFDQLKSIVKEFYKNEGRQHSSPIAPFPSLERLVFDDMSCWEEWSLPDSEAFPQLKSLQITACRMLKGDMVNHVLMRIVSSSSDVSKVRQLNIQDGERWSKKMRLDGDRLSISGFESVVECAFKARIIHHLNSLQEIYISWSESVVSLGGNCLPKSLQKLTIFHCHRIELLQQQQKYDLVDLQIYESCDSLTSLSLDAFPTLMNLQIKESSNLESVSTSEPPHASLQRLTIFNCSQLVSFPQEGLATPNLTHLDVSKCSKLEALPPGINTLLPNLESLDIQGCPNICRWPEGGLPANLKELSVRECEEQVRGLSWLGNLDNLIHLTISGRGSGSIIKSYPEVGSLPHLPSLTTLEICWFKNLETLECNELLHLTSLQQLHISSCWKLENMAGEKLPPSLLLLRIQWCSLLEEHCKNKHQLIWPKISHIPTIKFVDF